MDLALDPHHTALVVVDVQQAFAERDAAGEPRNNPEAEACIVELLSAFRSAGAAVFHIRHAGGPDSPFRRDRSGHAAQEAAHERPGETVIVKTTNSAFIGSDLEERLRAGGLETLVLCGATTNHCVETTTRMAGNLGFDTLLVRDACWTYDRVGPDGDRHLAADIHAMTLANLSDEFARVVRTAEVVAALGR